MSRQSVESGQLLADLRSTSTSRATDGKRRGRRQGPQRRDSRPLPHLRLARNSPAWSDSTAPSTCSTSNSTTSATGASARPVSTSRSPRAVAVRSSAAKPARTASTPRSSPRSAKLEGRLRRGKDRRKIHYGDKTPGVAGRRPPRSYRRPSRSSTTSQRPHSGDAAATRRPRARADRAHQGAPGQADDGRRRPLRDGARRPRLLPVPRQADRPALRWSTDGTPTTTG